MSDEWKKKLSEAHKGIPLSDEHRKSLSVARKGKPKSEEWKRKISESHKGLKHTEESKKRISIGHKGLLSGEKHPMFGKHHTEETIKLLSEKLSGSKHPCWKGGIAYEPYCQLWGDKEYKEDIKVRDNHQCQNPGCSGISNRLVIHHIDYDKKNCHPSNLITLCNCCNAKANFNREQHTVLYKNLVCGVQKC